MKLNCTIPGLPTALEAAADSAVSDDMLAKINAYSGVLRPMTAENCIVRTMFGLSDEPWRDEIIQVTPDELANIAKLALYEPVLFNHDRGWSVGKSAMPTGRLFDATLTTRAGSDANWIKLWWWTTNTESKRDLIADVDGGLISEVSTAFECKRIACSICGQDLGECDHRLLGQYDGKVCRGNPRSIIQVDEWSLVWKGRVRGTGLGLAAGVGDYSDELKGLLAKAAAPEREDDIARLLAAPCDRDHDPLASLFG